MFAEIVLGLFKFLRVEQQKMPQAAVGKLVDNRTAQELGQEIVDVGAHECADACGNYDQGYVQAGLGLQGLVGGRRHYQFRRERNEGTFDGHQERDGPVVQVCVVPIDNLRVESGGLGGWGRLRDRIGGCAGGGKCCGCKQSNNCES